MTTNCRFAMCCAGLLALLLAPAANAKLFLLFNVGDGEDREVSDAGETIEAAQDGNPPEVIHADAERYFVHLPHATMNTLSGAATLVGGDSADQAAPAAVASVSESADAAGSADQDEGDTGWVEYEAFAASLMLFSPDGEDEESEIRFEPARVFLRRFANGEVYTMITGEDGDPPPADSRE